MLNKFAKSASSLQLLGFSRPRRSACEGPSQARAIAAQWALGTDFAKICNFLAASFSAVSKRNFARKYAFDSIFKLYKICILLHRCNLKILAKICLKNQQFLWKFNKKFANVAKSAKFCQISKISAS